MHTCGYVTMETTLHIALETTKIDVFRQHIAAATVHGCNYIVLY